jgi:hypothetical protein
MENENQTGMIQQEDGSWHKRGIYLRAETPETLARRKELSKRSLKGSPEERAAVVEKRIAARRAMKQSHEQSGGTDHGK